MIFELCAEHFRFICPRIEIFKGRGKLCKKISHIKARITRILPCKYNKQNEEKFAERKIYLFNATRPNINVLIKFRSYLRQPMQIRFHVHVDLINLSWRRERELRLSNLITRCITLREHCSLMKQIRDKIRTNLRLNVLFFEIFCT